MAAGLPEHASNEGQRCERYSREVNIGEKPFNGTRHGVAIYFAFGSNAKGRIQVAAP
jgi:hypothetical protein